jgi:uncharacterized tellurite resistance protein B-like protein
MFGFLKRFIGSLQPVADVNLPHQADLQLAAAVLLLEVSAADFKQQPEERATLLAALRNVFDLNEEHAALLCERALKISNDAVSLHEFMTVINQRCTQVEKLYLLEQLWRVALADGRIDKYEDYRIRKIADLLYLSHREFIQCKHAAAVAPG